MANYEQERVKSVEIINGDLYLNGKLFPYSIDIDSFWEPNSLSEANGNRGCGALVLVIPVDPGFTLPIGRRISGSELSAHEDWSYSYEDAEREYKERWGDG